MLQTSGSPSIFKSQVVRRRVPCREHFEITLRCPGSLTAVPGQFVQILCRSACERATESDPVAHVPVTDPCGKALYESPMLRRPFSVGGMRSASNATEIDILGRVVGIGTAWLNGLQENDVVDLLGPLGRGFSFPPTGHRAILVAGGVGLPPIRWLGEWLRRDGVECAAIFGAQSRDLVPLKLTAEPAKTPVFQACVEEFARDGIPAIITTDDGSIGVPGRVTAALEPSLRRDANPGTLHVYACGPEAMLKAVADLCAASGVACELALERVMGCGMGTCQSCVVPVRDSTADEGWRYSLCCREGPVFDARHLIW